VKTFHDRELADAVVRLGELVLKFGQVDRFTYHPDGKRHESDTDHTVMLGLVACALAPHVHADLDLGLVAQYALVHDLVEVYAGDTNTLRIDDAGRISKATREAAAEARIDDEFGDTLPWLPRTIAEYEARQTPEARYVKALDKLLPKITHLLNGLATLREQCVTRSELAARYELQARELRGYASDFPALLDLRTDLVAMVLRRCGAVTV
jgi:putative hydrolase of HD superfamily